MAGYSSASDRFLEIFSNINSSAFFSMYVPTKEARLRFGRPSELGGGGLIC